jgi:hypothetical protein
MKYAYFVLGLLLAGYSSRAQTVFFSQDFSASSLVTDYTGGGPNRFTDIFAGGASTRSIQNSALVFDKAGGAGTGCRFTKIDELFETAPQVLYVQFSLTNATTEPTTNSNPFNYLYFGEAVANNGAIPSGATTFASLGFDFRFSDQLILRTPNPGPGGGTLTSAAFSGTQVITWIMNTGTEISTYDDGQGHVGTLEGARMDVWVGTTLVFDDARVTTPSIVPKTFKFLYSNGNGPIAFDDFTILGGASPLPVELTHFEAKALPTRQVEVRWKTASERDSEYFLLERSTDLRTFAPVARVPAAGTVSQPRQYQFLDEVLPPDVYYYRLTQVDLDGSRQVYRPVWVRVSEVGAGRKPFPNPAAGGRFAVANHDFNDSVALYDLTGTPIALERSTADGLLFVPRRPLPAGLYVVVIQTVEGHRTRHKLIVE